MEGGREGVRAWLAGVWIPETVGKGAWMAWGSRAFCGQEGELGLGECGDVDGHFVGCLFLFSLGVGCGFLRGGLLLYGGLMVVLSRCVVGVVLCRWL